MVHDTKADKFFHQQLRSLRNLSEGDLISWHSQQIKSQQVRLRGRQRNLHTRKIDNYGVQISRRKEGTINETTKRMRWLFQFLETFRETLIRAKFGLFFSEGSLSACQRVRAHANVLKHRFQHFTASTMLQVNSDYQIWCDGLLVVCLSPPLSPNARMPPPTNVHKSVVIFTFLSYGRGRY